jgi:glycosyltransferase involved in cell wall biosynthesis
VADEDTGLLVPPGDPAALAQAIRRAMDHPQELAEIAKRGTEFAERRFGWGAIVSDLKAAYESAVQRRSRK